MKFESSEKHVSGIFGELKAEVQLDMGISDFNRAEILNGPGGTEHACPFASDMTKM
jgi:hypothetical protein